MPRLHREALAALIEALPQCWAAGAYALGRILAEAPLWSDDPFFENRLRLPLISSAETDQLKRIYEEFFTHSGMFDVDARRPFFEQMDPPTNFPYQAPYKKAPSIQEAVVELVRIINDYTPSHQYPEYHPLVKLHQLIIDRLASANSIQSAQALLNQSDQQCIEQLLRRVDAALPALRAGAAAGLLQRHSRGEFAAISNAVLLHCEDADLLLVPAERTRQNPVIQYKVRLSYRYPQLGAEDSYSFQTVDTLSTGHVTIAALKLLEAQAQRGLGPNEINWNDPTPNDPAMIWCYQSDDQTAQCIKRRLLRYYKDKERYSHDFGALGELAFGAPIFDRNWRLVALYMDQNWALGMRELHQIRPAEPPNPPWSGKSDVESISVDDRFRNYQLVTKLVNDLERAFLVETNPIEKAKLEDQLAEKRREREAIARELGLPLE